MLARVSDPGDYQAFQHFITSAPWAADGLWRQLRRVVPAREGVLIFDGTSFPKQGDRSVGVARQYCGALGKIANCQVATTAALWTGTHAWFLGAQLYLPQGVDHPGGAGTRPDPRDRPLSGKVAPCPDAVSADSRRRISDHRRLGGCRVWRQFHAAGRVAPRGIPYAVGVSSTLGVFVRPPALDRPPARPGRGGRPRTIPLLPAGRTPCSVATLVATWPATAWRSITWRNAPAARAWTARFAAQRITPAHAWRRRQRAPEVWLLAERDRGATPRTKYYLVHLPATASLRSLVRLAHQRWAIEQQYQELKDELGLDHFG